MIGCGTYGGLEIRPELKVALDAMSARGRHYDYAVCPTWDGQGWEVNTRTGQIGFTLPGRHPTEAEAIAAGEAWLRGLIAQGIDVTTARRTTRKGRIKVDELSQFDSARYLDSEEAIEAYLVDISLANDAGLVADALRTVARVREMNAADARRGKP